MKRALSLLPCLFLWVACVDSSCPAGSTEVDGTCQMIEPVEDGDASTGDGGDDVEADGGARGDGGSGSETGDRDGGEGDGGVDEAAPADPCAQLSCAEHAHCEVEEEVASCVCDEGYDGDGTRCEVDPCAADPCDAETSSCAVEDSAAVCECLDGLARCDGDELACTTQLESDAAHCGACGAACAGNLACEAGACEQKVVQLSLGSEHSCALAADGEILCWGSNADERLLRAAGSGPGHEAVATRIGKARLLAAGPTSSCAVLDDDELVCWGSNNPFQWIASGAQRGLFTLGSGFDDVEALAVGVFAACLVIAGEAECWGLSQSFDGSGELLSFADRKSIALPSDIVQLSMGRDTCALSHDGRVRCWGDTQASPAVIEDASGPLEDVQRVVVSSTGGASCALLGDGRIQCWGPNDKGQLGNMSAPVTGTRAAEAVPVTDQAGNTLADFVQVAVGQSHGCGLQHDGRVLCWGQINRLGSGATSSAAQSYATEVDGLGDAIEVAAGAKHTCVRRKSGQAQCWGDNTSAQLGVPLLSVGGVESSAVPANVSGLP